VSAQAIPFQRASNRLFSMADKKDFASSPVDEDVKKYEELFQLSKAYRDEDLKMQERWRSYRSWVLSTGRDRSGFNNSTTYVNLIYSSTEQLHADLTEAMPTFNYRPTSPDSLRLAEHLNRSVPAIWEANNGDRTYRQSIKSAIVYGTDIWKVEHDPGYGGRGIKVGFRRVPCYRFFPAPYATDIESAPFVIEVCPRTVEEIYNDYGVRVAPELEPKAEFPDVSEDLDDPKGRTMTWATNLTGTAAVPHFPSSFMLSSDQDRSAGIVWQKELWIRDPRMEARYWIEPTPKGPQLNHGKDLAYPRGRVISWANGKLLYDRENPYMDGKWPYVRFADVPWPETFWGLGEVPNLINLQLLHDDTIDTMRLIHAYMANGRLIVDESTGLREREIGNDPGEILFTRRGTHDRIKWLPGLTPPAEFYTHVGAVERWFDQITGRMDVTRGINPSGVTAARALVALQRAAGIRVRGRMREIEDSLLDAGRMLASRTQQFAPSSMQLPDGKEFKDFSMSEEERLMPFHLKVDVVSNLDDLRALEFQKLLLLYNMGMVDDTRLLKDSGLSSSEVLLAELPQVREKHMMMQAMAATGGMNDITANLSNTQKGIGRSLRTAVE